MTAKFGAPPADPTTGQQPAVNVAQLSGAALKATPTAGVLGVALYDGGSGTGGVGVQGVMGDQGSAGLGSLITSASILLSMGGFNSPQQLLRSPITFKGLRTQAINAAAAIWTPAAGKKFRLMAYKLSISGNAALAAATECLFKLQDAATDIHGGAGDDVLIPAAAGAGPTLYVGPWVILPGNGYLSALANNVLNLAATGAAAGLTSGHVDIIALGTEE